MIKGHQEYMYSIILMENWSIEDVMTIISGIKEANIEGIEEIVDISVLPPQALSAFLSEDKTTMIVPMNLKAGLGNATKR